VRRRGTAPSGARLLAFCLIGLNVAGVAWLAMVEHDVAAAATVALFAVAIVLANVHASKAASSVGSRRMVRHGTVLLPEDFGAPEARVTDRIDPPKPRLGAPGSLN
jgi:hypothetical protein